jgi:hypothetical protein
MFNRKVWVAIGLALALSSAVAATPRIDEAFANSACTAQCQAAYAQCYKSSGSNRKQCDAQLQQCLASCIGRR